MGISKPLRLLDFQRILIFLLIKAYDSKEVLMLIKKYKIKVPINNYEIQFHISYYLLLFCFAVKISLKLLSSFWT